MDHKVVIVAEKVLYTHFLLVLSIAFVSHGASITSCNQTPFPGVCHHYMATANFVSDTNLRGNKLNQANVAQLAFRDLALNVTMVQATKLHRSISNMDRDSFNDRAKSAWFDCLELYRDTTYQLNLSLDNPVSPIDTQTWLSAAMANQETCKNGFIDLNINLSTYSKYYNYFPLAMHHNLSKLISNSLAISKAAADEFSAPFAKFSKQSGSGGRRLLSYAKFPSWVKNSDRKLLEASGTPVKVDVVVAQDGSGHYKTISEAVAAAAAAKLRRRPESGQKRFVIYVKAGVYKEQIDIKKSLKNLMVIGDGVDATIVTGNNNVGDGTTTFRSATFAVSGEGFMARDITFENTAGPAAHQAVALRSGSDFSVFYRCSFRGYQDTLYLHSHRQFYRNCDIYGTVDFIFGDAAAVLQNCNIYVRRPMSGQKNTVTAQSRKDPNENTGIVIHNSIVTAASDTDTPPRETYLGRPWREYSRTVFIKCFLDGRLVNPEGWLPWNGNFGLSTVYYGEYMNNGGGADTAGRVKWPGFHVIRSASEAGRFTVGNFLAGNSWIPATGVPFDSGL